MLAGVMVRLVAQRIVTGLVLIVLVSMLIFAGTQMMPGDVAATILGQAATPEALANLREQLGLNVPAWQRYLSWLGGVLHGDLGRSLTNGRDIAQAIGERLGNTLFLAFWAALISVPLAIGLGLVSVLYRGRWPDRLISALSLASISVPEFMMSYILMFFVAVQLGWLPSVAMIDPSMGLWAKLQAVALPVLVLVLVVLAHMMRMTRAALLNVMQSPYVETAELKGLRRSTVIWRHALPNAVAPIVNVVMLNMAYLVVGVVVVEVVFVYPGMGQYLVDHVAKRDVPVVQACGVVFAAVYITLNMLADVISILANPRLRHPK
ncbi:ABC transporter permease [Paenirhodobacter sp.]|uniref:ABC transporter permease n=1 Tax=Paenirhodobacter sp. TaxID=1965326 RepID=UPI003B4064DB